MRVLLAIPTYNRAEMLGGSLDSLARLVIPPSISEVRALVIANNCTDSTEQVVVERIKSFPFELRYVNEKQQGLCFGRNRAINEARSVDYLGLLDDDIAIHPLWLEGLNQSVQQFAPDAVVGPVYAKFLGDIPEFLTDKARRSLSSPYSLKGDTPQKLDPAVAHEIPGCNFAVKVQSAEAIGGFDSQLDRAGKGLLAGGDFDFGHRLVRAGFSVAYHPTCAIDHLIATEKLNAPYVRRRWRGTGATVRVMVQRTGIRRPKRYSMRSLVLWWLAARWFGMFGNSHRAFDACLEWEKQRGFFWGA